MPVTFALVQATPAHIYKAEPRKKVYAAQNVPSVPKPTVTVAAVQTETPAPAPVVEQASPAPVAVVAQVTPGCGDNQYANYIYMHESGCNTSAVNYLGCRGIGQACPGSKLPCGADYTCQNVYFTNYAIARYGSWYSAYVYWLNNHWW